MGKDTKTKANLDRPMTGGMPIEAPDAKAEVPYATTGLAIPAGDAIADAYFAEQPITDIKTTVIAVMDHVIALTTAVQAIAVGGRRPQNVRELDEAVTAARAYRKTL